MLAVLVLLGGRALAQHNLDSIYRCLDEEIERFPQYVEAREQEADNLREQWQTATSDSARYRLAYRLYEQYHAFVWADEPRNNYVYDEDANGAFVVRNTDNIENEQIKY